MYIYSFAIFLEKIDRLVWELKALKKKKYVFVNNKRTVIARNFFLENIGRNSLLNF